MIYIHHHLGLGDHIVCNAIVREQYNNFGPLTLAVKHHNYPSVKQLYKDIDIKYDLVNSDLDCYSNYFKYPTLRIGFENCKSDWEKSFYDQVGMKYSDRFSKFYIDRDYDRELYLQNKLELPDQFAFVNNSSSNGNKNIVINTKFPIVQLKPLTESIFDWIGVLEKAKEIHTIDSSIYQLIKQLNLEGKKFFYDLRKIDPTRTIPPFEDSSWSIL
jgi:hypothetical protein